MTETYSLVQTELGAAIDRQTLEDASVAAPSVGRADCARISRELFGVIVSGIPIEDALAFRAALLARKFSVEIAADRDLPRLPDGQFFNSLAVSDDGALMFSDVLGRREVCRADEMLLLAAGFMRRLRAKTEFKEVRIPYQRGTTDFDRNGNLVERQHNLVSVPEFRFEWFIKRKPHRLRLMLDDNTHFVWNNHTLRLGKPDAIRAFMKTWRRHAPRVPWNLGLTNSGDDFEYPGRRAFENEIRWRFYKLKQRARSVADGQRVCFNK
jgi:hypothetical protein